MTWVVTLTDIHGNIFYGSPADREGLRWRSSTQDGAEIFESKEKAESVFYHFRQMRDLKPYQLRAIKVGSI